MQEIIAHGDGAKAVRAQAERDGYVPMREYGWVKVMQGGTTIEEVISVTTSDLGGE
jgi:type II secretory ATPase GspE/PulE/Tfp pilus assembly ATPase PilB-like protein